MKYHERTVQSDPGMAQEEALVSLQRSSSFQPGTIIKSFRRVGSAWKAILLVPKTAGEPPAFVEEGDEGPEAPEPDGPPSDEGPPSDGPPSDEESSDEPTDGPPSPDGGEGGDKPEHGKEPSTEDKVLHVLEQILHALQGGGAPEGMGGLDALGPGPSGPATPPAPKHAPPGGPGLDAGPAGKPPTGAGAKLRPGETRNTPGTTPVGSPAFSHKQAFGELPGAGDAAQTALPTGQAGPTGLAGGGNCPECGYPEPCPLHSGGANMGDMGAGVNGGQPGGVPNNALYGAVQAQRGSPTITLKAPGTSFTNIAEAVKQARPAVEAHGYQIKQAKRVGEKIVILASVR
jgi:hypothetical protein